MRRDSKPGASAALIAPVFRLATGVPLSVWTGAETRSIETRVLRQQISRDQRLAVGTVGEYHARQEDCDGKAKVQLARHRGEGFQ